MKRTTIIFFAALAALTVSAQQKPSLLKKAVEMEKLRKEGRLLEAMDTATLILTYDKDYRVAADFVHRHWDKTMRQTEDRLSQLSDNESLEQAEERCEIYRMLDEVHDNLRDIRMPLYGPNQKWVWQPEVSYYTGHYDNERQKTLQLLLRKADEALRSFDAETAGEYYHRALTRYLLTDGEKRSNKRVMTEQCNTMIERYQKSDKIYDAIFAYDLCSLSLRLDSTQTGVSDIQQSVQRHVAELYLQAAEAAEQVGDTVEAYELRLSYEDWK